MGQGVNELRMRRHDRYAFNIDSRDSRHFRRFSNSGEFLRMSSSECEPALDGPHHRNVNSDITTRKFTSKELRELNKRHNAHVAYRGKVYNVSSFVAEHPGGMDQIMLGAGRDITTVFESYHSPNVLEVLEKFYVGELVDSELPVFSPRGKFYQTLKERVDDYFITNRIDPKIDYWYFLRCILFLMMTITSGVLAFTFHEYWVPSVLFAVSWGFFSAQVGNFCHDASHFSITHTPFIWKLFGSCHDFFLGASIYIWHHQHILGHHPFTNIDGVDPDIVPINTEIPDIRRIKATQKWIPVYFFQHLYMPVLYGLLGIKTKLTDLYNIITMRITTMDVNPPSGSQMLVFCGGKITHGILRLYVPYLFIPFSTVLFINMIAEMTAGYWLALLFETSHDNDVVEWYKPDENNIMHVDWAEMQVVSTQDWATDSWFWTTFSGAINHQVAHHLFPSMIPTYYRQITPIIRQTCQEFGLKYHCVDSVQQAIRSHLGHLQSMGQVDMVRKDKGKKLA